MKNNKRQEVDGIEVAAIMKSLAYTLHRVIREGSEVTPDMIHYLYMEYVNDLFQFARMPTTITKLQMILDILQCAKNALGREKEVELLLRGAWCLMRKVVSHEVIDKKTANQIELRGSEMDPIILARGDVWEQANRLLQGWSIPEHEGQQVNYSVSYSNGFQDERWLKLPLLYTMHDGKRFLTGPALDLGKQIIAAQEKSIDLSSEQQASFDKARDAALTYLRHYEVGGSAGTEAVTEAIIKIQEKQWSPEIIYRRALHFDLDQRERSL